MEISTCQHIMASGLRCATPPMKQNQFCYHHRRLHDNYCLPGQYNYQPDPLDSPQAITLMLHHLELALNKSLITLKDYKARLFAIQLAITNLKQASQNTPSPEKIVTAYTPAMRDLHHINPNEPCTDDEPRRNGDQVCENDEPCGDRRPRPSGRCEAPASAAIPLTPPCPIEWLQPANLPESGNPNRLWYPLTGEELQTYNLPADNQLGTLQQEHQLRRMKLNLHLGKLPNPTIFQLEQTIKQIEAEETAVNPALSCRRGLLFEQSQPFTTPKESEPLVSL